MYKEIKEWINRYMPAEIFATFTAMLGAMSIYFITGNKIAAAYAGTLGEGIGYYSFIIIRDITNSIKEDNKINQHYGIIHFIKDIRNIMLEFGFSEILDMFVIRPLCMYIFTVWISNFGVGILVGKLAADIVFYIPTTIAYRLEKKYLKR